MTPRQKSFAASAVMLAGSALALCLVDIATKRREIAELRQELAEERSTCRNMASANALRQFEKDRGQAARLFVVKNAFREVVFAHCMAQGARATGEEWNIRVSIRCGKLAEDLAKIAAEKGGMEAAP